MVDMSPESPFVQQMQAKDSRFDYRRTPRTEGGTTQRWKEADYSVVFHSSPVGSGKSPFAAAEAATGKNFDRFAAATARRKGNWKRESYIVEKQVNNATQLSDASPFTVPPGPDTRFAATTARRQGGWDRKSYVMKKRDGDATQLSEASPFTVPAGPDTRFVGYKKTDWNEAHYRSFRLAQGAKGVSANESPFKNHTSKETPRTESRNRFARSGMCGDFDVGEAQKSFAATKAAAMAVKQRCLGVGKAGAREAIFGGEKK